MGTVDDKTRKALRVFNNCPCGSPSNTFGPNPFGRGMDKEGKWNNALYMHKQIEHVTGILPKKCPWWYLQRDPFVTEILGLLKKVEINPALFDERLPTALYQGIIFYKGMYNKCKNHWWDVDQKEREDKERMQKAKEKMKEGTRAARGR